MKLRYLILLLHLYEFGYRSQIFQWQVWKGCLQKTTLTDGLTSACVPQVTGEHGNVQQLASQATQTNGMDNAPPGMECGACGPLPEAELRKEDTKLPNMMVEAARHSRQKCEEPADVVARVVVGMIGFHRWSGDLCVKQPNSQTKQELKTGVRDPSAS